MRQATLAGEPIPDAIKDAPSLLPGLGLFFSAYWELASDRPQGFGPGRIPWSSISRYCDRSGLSEEQFEDMVYHFTRMDDTFIAHVESKGK